MNEPVEVELSQWMHRCLILADEARRHGDAPVGAVIVRKGVLIAEAFEQVKANKDVAAHAELIAIQQACQMLGTTRLTECQLFTNVEPCWMCSFAIRETGIGQVVIGRAVAEIGGVTSRFPILTDAIFDDWGSPPKVIWWTIVGRKEQTEGDHRKKGEF